MVCKSSGEPHALPSIITVIKLAAKVQDKSELLMPEVTIRSIAYNLTVSCLFSLKPSARLEPFV